MRVGYWKGKKFSEEYRRKLSEAHKGKKLSEEHARNMGLVRRGEKNPKWKGDNVGYFALHSYLRRHMPLPQICPRCNKSPPRHLANITGIYNRDFKNWEYMCVKCHVGFDFGLNPRKTTAFWKGKRLSDAHKRHVSEALKGKKKGSFRA